MIFAVVMLEQYAMVVEGSGGPQTVSCSSVTLFSFGAAAGAWLPKQQLRELLRGFRGSSPFRLPGASGACNDHPLTVHHSSLAPISAKVN